MSDNAFAPGSRPRGDRACAAGLTQIMSALIGVRGMRRNLACPPWRRLSTRSPEGGRETFSLRASWQRQPLRLQTS